MPRFCPHCGSILVGRELFCATCGTPAEPNISPGRNKQDAAVSEAQRRARVHLGLFVAAIGVLLLVFVVKFSSEGPQPDAKAVTASPIPVQKKESAPSPLPPKDNPTAEQPESAPN